MQRSGRLGLIALLAVALTLTVGGSLAAWRELGVFAVGGSGPATRFAALAAGAYAPAASLLSKRVVLDTCLEAMAGVHGRLRPTAERRAVATECRAQADAIVATVPSYSFAWYVGALAAARLDDVAGFNRRLLRSQITGSAEQWVAELRVALVEENRTRATAAVLARHRSDLRLLVASRRGIASISARYVAEPGFRDRIAAIVEAMPEADQARFVRTVRAAAGSP